MIWVQVDAEGARTAMRELQEHAFLVELADGRGYTPDLQETLSPGYYRWARHLFWLDAHVSAGTQVGMLSAVEAEGLLQLRSARSEWERDHPPCSYCGERQMMRHVASCRACGKKLGKRN